MPKFVSENVDFTTTPPPPREVFLCTCILRTDTGAQIKLELANKVFYHLREAESKSG